MNVELRDEARADLVTGAVFYGEQSVGLDEHLDEPSGVRLELLGGRKRHTMPL